jgi:hypothetical protein
MRKSIAALLALALLALGVPTAAWSGLAGNSVRIDYLYPTVDDSLANAVFVAPFSDLPYTCCLSNEFSPVDSEILISVGDDNIVIVGDRSQVFTAAGFNGLSFLDVLGSIEPITGVMLVESTLPGLDASDIDFNSERVLINFAGADGLDLDTWRVALRLRFGEGGGGTLTEPGTLALGAFALICLGATGRLGRAYGALRRGRVV